MALAIIVILVLGVFILWSISSGIKTMEDALKQPRGPCPYCGATWHKKTWHNPGGGNR